MFKQKDIVLVDFPFTDLSGTKLRPALILSSDLVNQKDEYVCLQITSQMQHDGLFIEIKNNDLVKPMKLKSGIRIHKIFTAQKSLVYSKLSEMKAGAFKNVVEEVNLKVLS
jgi:mRNA interferase MazF